MNLGLSLPLYLYLISNYKNIELQNLLGPYKRLKILKILKISKILGNLH